MSAEDRVFPILMTQSSARSPILVDALFSERT